MILCIAARGNKFKYIFLALSLGAGWDYAGRMVIRSTVPNFIASLEE
jgi:hypothetical protein